MKIIMKYILLLVTFYVFGMREEKASLPTLSNLESLKEYTLTESYKCFFWTTGAVSLIAASSYGLKKFPQLVERLALLQKSSLKNSKIIGGLALASFALPQVINFTTYRHLATTSDMNDFKIQNRKEKDVSYTKYYFRPNPLKVLVSRLVKIDSTESRAEIYEDIINTLSISNFEELFSYLANRSETSKFETNLMNTIEASLKVKIENLTKESDPKNWAIIFYLLSKTETSLAEEYYKGINNKIKTFDENKLIQTWIEISKKEYDNLIEQYELIKKINPELATKFSDTYLDQLIAQLDESKITSEGNNLLIDKFAYVFSFLDKTNIGENIRKVESRLKYILENSTDKNKVINTLISYYTEYNKIHKSNKEFKKLFIFLSHFALHFMTYLFQGEDKADKIRIFFANSLYILIQVKEQNEKLCDELVNEYKDYLVSYLKGHKILEMKGDKRIKDRLEKIKERLKKLNIEIE
jgi:hypothetical protein